MQDCASLFYAQPADLQGFFEVQGRSLAEALVQGSRGLRLRLPDRVLLPGGEESRAIPARLRTQVVRSRFYLKRQRDNQLLPVLQDYLARLECSCDLGMAASASLIRHTAALYILHGLVPEGHPVQYLAAGGAEIPTIPISPGADGQFENCPAAARVFYLPEWVAFDDQGVLLVGSAEEAGRCVADLQRFLELLGLAVALAPSLEEDEAYQQKRYGLLGQLVNQGRALAYYQTRQMIAYIQRRAAANTLNRGLSLSVPYFNDRALELKTDDFEVIPQGRVLFVPAFVVCAVRQEEERVSQDASLSPSTRNHLLAELRTIERAFSTPGGSPRSGLKVDKKRPVGQIVPQVLGLNQAN